jgi:imidazoleglycerol phosphate dehydratase HisB
MHYNNDLPSPYHHRIEDKAIDNIGYAFHTCLEYEEQIERIGPPSYNLYKT